MLKGSLRPPLLVTNDRGSVRVAVMITLLLFHGITIKKIVFLGFCNSAKKQYLRKNRRNYVIRKGATTACRCTWNAPKADREYPSLTEGGDPNAPMKRTEGRTLE